MRIEGNDRWYPLPEGEDTGLTGRQPLPTRLDSLLPAEPETGAVTFAAFRVALNAWMEMANRYMQPLTLVYVAADSGEKLRFLGPEGSTLIGQALARWLRQETRAYDLVGRADKEGAHGVPAFLMACLLMDEAHATQLGERLLAAMTTYAADEGAPWLSVSVGVAALGLDVRDADSLIHRAEEALYAAQRAGGGRVWQYSDIRRQAQEQNPPDSQDE